MYLGFVVWMNVLMRLEWEATNLVLQSTSAKYKLRCQRVNGWVFILNTCYSSLRLFFSLRFTHHIHASAFHFHLLVLQHPTQI